MNSRLPFRYSIRVIPFVIAGFILGIGCIPNAQPSPKPQVQKPIPVAPQAEPANPWPAERISADPQGFCSWADQQLQEQLNLLRGNRTKLSEKLEQLNTKKRSFIENLQEIRNLSTRAITALRKAEDEDRWPVKFAGKSFSREKLEALVAVTTKYVEQRKPLEDDYLRAAQRLGLEIRKVDEQIAEVTRQTEIVALDFERIKLSNELDGLPQLDSSKLNITAITRSLARPDAAESLALEIEDLTTGSAPAMTLDSFLKNEQDR